MEKRKEDTIPTWVKVCTVLAMGFLTVAIFLFVNALFTNIIADLGRS